MSGVGAKGSQLCFSLVSLNALAWALGLRCLVTCWINTRCRKWGLVAPKLPVASSSMQPSCVGEGSTGSVEGRWLFTWGSNANLSGNGGGLSMCLTKECSFINFSKTSVTFPSPPPPTPPLCVHTYNEEHVLEQPCNSHLAGCGDSA